MQNVPSTDLGTASKIEFVGLSRFSAVSMSSTLFSSFLNYDAGLNTQTQLSAELNNTWQGVLPRADETAVRVETAQSSQAVTQTTTQAANQTVNRATTRTATDTKPARAAENNSHATTENHASKSAKEEDEESLEDMKDVAVDPDALAALMPKLQKYGLSDEDAATLTARAKSAEGLTWGQLVEFVAEKTGNQLGGLNLDSGQKQRFMTLFQKAGFSSADAEKLVNRMQSGDLDGVVSTLKDKLAALDKQGQASLDTKEIKSLVDELSQLKARTDADSMGLVRSIADSMRSALEKLRAQLLGQGLTQTTQNGTDQALVNTSVAEASQYDPARKVVDRKAAIANAGKVLNTLDNSEQASLASDRIQDATARQLSMSGEKTADQFMQQNDLAKEQSQAKSDKAWSEFTARLRQDAAASGQRITGEALDMLAGKDGLGQTQNASTRTASQGQTQAQAKAWLNTNAPRLLSQVQDGIYKTMSSGQKQLTLNLNPAELGQMTLIVKTNGKEISATIRAENPEAARVIADNLDQVR